MFFKFYGIKLKPKRQNYYRDFQLLRNIFAMLLVLT